MDKGELGQHFSEKGKDVGIVICTIAADNVLLAIWVVIESIFEHYLVPRFPLASELSRVCFLIFRIIFALSTLCPPLIFLYRDVSTMWLRARTAVRREAVVVNASGAEGHK
jgi:hypothetical protein